MIRILVCLLFLSLYAAHSLAQEKNSAAAQQVDRLLSGHFKPDAPGLSVAVWQQDELLFAKGYGMADPEQQVPNGPSTIFDIADLSRQFTAFAIASLADSGKLSPDDEVRKYIPELHDFGQPLRIRHLLQHCSGLSDHDDLLYLQGYRDGDAVDNDQLLSLIFRQQKLSFEPGKQFRYCHSDYTLLALIVERVSKTFFPIWIYRNVLLPLKMEHSFFLSDPDMIIGGKARCYSGDTGNYQPLSYRSAGMGARGMQSSVEDLVLWLRHLSVAAAGNKRILEIMNSVPSGKDPQKYHYGQVFTSYRGFRLIGHEGVAAGYRSYMARFPERGFVLAVAGNLESVNARNIAMQIADIYLEPETGFPIIDTATRIILPESFISDLEGQYRIGPDSLLTLRANGQVVMAKITGKKKEYSLRPLSASALDFPELGARLSLKKDSQTGMDSLLLIRDGKPRVIPRIPFAGSCLEALREYEGLYVSEQLAVKYQISLVGNHLEVTLPGTTRIRLRQRDDNGFYGAYPWFRALKFRRDSRRKISGFELFAEHSSALEFRREQ